MRFYFLGQTHTLASALRTALEGRASDEQFVCCAVMHPLDAHVEVEAPSEQFLRHALLDLKADLAALRVGPRFASK